MEVKKRSGLSYKKLLKTLNCGIGLVLSVESEKLDQISSWFAEKDITAFNIGEVLLEAEEPGIVYPTEWID